MALRPRHKLALISAFIALLLMAILLVNLQSRQPGSSAASQSPQEPSTQPTTNPSPAPQGVFFLSGDVRAPGAYNFSGQQITVRQAVNLAGITNPQGIALILIIRRQGNTEELIKVDPGPLLTEGKQDEPLRPNDIVQVQK